MDESYLRRPDIFPKSLSAYVLFTVLFLMIPSTYWFELYVVFPYTLSNHPVLYWSLFILGHFTLHNIVGNLLAFLLFDTSIRGRKMPSEKELGVQYCNICDTYTPPRTFHCSACNICILKRDHHCDFTSCCVGFYNHRFFVCFLIYLAISTVISLPFNIYFLWNVITYSEFLYYIKFLFPLIALFIEAEAEYTHMKHIYLTVGTVGLIGAVLSIICLKYQLKLVFKGAVSYELKRRINTYNFGTKKNLELVFGKRWCLALLSPYIKSPLICYAVKYNISD